MARRRADPGKGKRVKLYHSKRWLVTRRKVLVEEPICADPSCKELSTDVDHIVPLSQGGAEFERSNLQSLCSYHHSLKSGQESIAARGGFDDAA